jgi:hypothetical protein
MQLVNSKASLIPTISMARIPLPSTVKCSLEQLIEVGIPPWILVYKSNKLTAMVKLALHIIASFNGINGKKWSPF